MLAETYPYTGKDGNCEYSQRKASEALVDHFVSVEKESVSALKIALNLQPVSVNVDCNIVFEFYSSGIFNSPLCGTNINHAVLAVGYGHDEPTGLDYWLIKNSFGEEWGEQGYIRMAAVDGPGICAVTMTHPSYPVLV